MELTTRDVQHLARLAGLHPADGQAAGWLGPLEEMLAYVRTLPTVSTPTVSIEVVESPRDGLPVDGLPVEYADEPHDCLSSEVVLANAPTHRGDWVTVAAPAGHMRAGHTRATIRAVYDRGGEPV